MLSALKKWWKFSSFRFYFLNAKHNYSFWLSCTREYRTFEYYEYKFFKNEHKRLNEETNKLSKKRFIGYQYKNKLHIDNTGFEIKDREVWEHWRKKGLI